MSSCWTDTDDVLSKLSHEHSPHTHTHPTFCSNSTLPRCGGKVFLCPSLGCPVHYPFATTALYSASPINLHHTLLLRHTTSCPTICFHALTLERKSERERKGSTLTVTHTHINLRRKSFSFRRWRTGKRTGSRTLSEWNRRLSISTAKYGMIDRTSLEKSPPTPPFFLPPSRGVDGEEDREVFPFGKWRGGG